MLIIIIIKVNTTTTIIILKIKRHKKGNDEREFFVSLSSLKIIHFIQKQYPQTRTETTIKTTKDDERIRYTLYSNKTCNKHVHISCKNVSLPFILRNSVICFMMRLCMATPNWASFNERATVIWGNFFTVLGVVVVACSSSSCCCFVGVASSFSSSTTDGAVVFVFLDVFFFVVFSAILFVFVSKKVEIFQFYVNSSIKFIIFISLFLSSNSSLNKNNLITWLE